jgi:CHAT domain-containing protein/tetratricopeptide (TPR) repeat protein
MFSKKNPPSLLKILDAPTAMAMTYCSLFIILELHCKFCLLLGHINRAIGSLDEADMQYKKAKEMAASNNDLLSLSCVYEQLCIYARGDNSGPLDSLTLLLNETALSKATQVVLHQALANIYRSAADRHKSTAHFKIAIQLAKVEGDMSKAMECRGELGRAYRSSGCHSKALKRQKKFLEYAIDRGDIASIANACGYVGFTYYSMGKEFHDEAIKYLYCKLELSRTELEDLVGYRWCLNNIGKVYLRLKEHDLCMQHFTESADIAKQLGITLGLGTAYGNLGSACREIGKHHDAVKYHHLYLEIALKNADTGGVAIMQRELILDHLYLYRDETDVEKKSLFLTEAEMYAFKAMKTCLEIRSRLRNEDDTLKIGNFEHSQAEIYSLFLYIAIEQGQYEAGLVFSELGRAHALADLMKHKFEVDSNFLEDIFATVGSDDQINPSALCSVLKNLGRLVSRSNSHILVYSTVENPLSEIKERFLYTWHVWKGSDHGVQIHFKQCTLSLNKNNTDDSLVDDYISCLMRQVQLAETPPAGQESQGGNPSPVSRDVIRRRKPAAVPKVDEFEELYNVLVDPVSQYLYDSSYRQGARLIIIPQGFLFGVPFCALQKHGHFLVEDFVMSLSPSLYLLDVGLQREEEWSRILQSNMDDLRVLAVGNPKMPEEDIPQLPGAEKEVNSIRSSSMNVTVLSGAGATKQAVLDGFTKHSVVHLATHAIIEASLSDTLAAELGTKADTHNIGDYSVKGAVILAKSDSLCSGVLTSLEIEKLCLEPSCELVVLSCCKTGRGKITGDGILGLSRSLMCAGVLNMVVTHWPILDESTSLLMEHFYSHYCVSRDAPAAVRLSMLHLIRNQYHVKQWAPFCCFGTRYS